MKKIFLSLTILGALGCGNVSEDKLLPSGAVMILDAADLNANGTTPATGCSFTSWADKSGNSNNGTFTCGSGGYTGSGATNAPYAVRFDGTTSRVTTSLNAQASAMPASSWVIWFKPSKGSPLQHLLSLDNHSGAFNRSLVINSSNIEAFTGTTTNFSATTADLSQWQHVALVYTSSNVMIYKNGTGYSRAFGPTINNTAQTLTIGRSAGGAFDYFEGEIAWVGVYDRELTANEVYNSCKALEARFGGVTCR